MKKLVVFALAIVMCLATLSFTACGDTSQLEKRIAQLEQELATAKQAGGIKGDTGPQGPQGPKGEPGASNGNVDELPIYKFGETATIYFNSVKMFSITYKEKPTVTSFNFYFTNYGLGRCYTDDVISGHLQGPASSDVASFTIQRTFITLDTTDFLLVGSHANYGGLNLDRIYFYSKNSLLTYAVFEI